MTCAVCSLKSVGLLKFTYRRWTRSNSQLHKMASAQHGVNASLVHGSTDTPDSSEAIAIDMEEEEEDTPWSRIQSKQLSFNADAPWLPLLTRYERGGSADDSALTKIAASVWCIFEALMGMILWHHDSGIYMSFPTCACAILMPPALRTRVWTAHRAYLAPACS